MRAGLALLAALLSAVPAAHARDGAAMASASDSCLGVGVAPADPDFRQCHRGAASEFRFHVPGALAAHPDVLAQVNRVNSELVEGFDTWLGLAAAEADPPMFLTVTLDWRVTGVHDHLASLVAMSEMVLRPERRPGPPDRNAIAMVIDRRDGRMLPDVTDIFLDRLESQRSTYCAFLDIQRIANAVNSDPAAGGEGRPPIIDDRERYLGEWPCPHFQELAIAFQSSRPGEPFHRLILIAPPGTAGPHHEGYYHVDLPVVPELIEQIRPEYRAAFRAALPCEDLPSAYCEGEMERP